MLILIDANMSLSINSSLYMSIVCRDNVEITQSNEEGFFLILFKSNKIGSRCKVGCKEEGNPHVF